MTVCGDSGPGCPPLGIMCSPESRCAPTAAPEDPDDLAAVLFLDWVWCSWRIVLHVGLEACVGGTVEILIFPGVAFLIHLTLSGWFH